MSGAQTIEIYSFLLIYILLLIVLFIMKRAKIEKTKLLLWASLKMTIQLIIAGFLLTYIFENPRPIWTMA
ncbi:MAG: ABC transporter permease, partial [Anaerovorax sp.]